MLPWLLLLVVLLLPLVVSLLIYADPSNVAVLESYLEFVNNSIGDLWVIIDSAIRKLVSHL